MRIFEDDDVGYLAWIDDHQHGFVVNTYRKPDPLYLILHRATCGTIRGKLPAASAGRPASDRPLHQSVPRDPRRSRPVGAPDRRRRAASVRSLPARLIAFSGWRRGSRLFVGLDP